MPILPETAKTLAELYKAWPIAMEVRHCCKLSYLMVAEIKRH